MLAWRVRQVRVHVPGDTPQWCIDNGEDDLIPCGSSETGKERASQLVETLNLGHAVKARKASKNPNDNPVTKAAMEIYEKCQEIDIMIQAAFPQRVQNPQIEDIRSKLVELQTHSAELQKSLFG